MKWRDLLLTLALLLVLAPWIQAQTQPVGSAFSGRFPVGSATNLPISFVGDTTTGLYDASGRIVFVSAGTPQMSIAGTQIEVQASAVLGFSSTGDVAAANSDAAFARVGSATIGVTNGSATGKGAIQSGAGVVLALPAGAYGFATASTSSVGNTGQGARLVVVCGPTAGTSSLLYYSGTTNTPVVLANAVGGGLIGC